MSMGSLRGTTPEAFHIKMPQQPFHNAGKTHVDPRQLNAGIALTSQQTKPILTHNGGSAFS